MKAIVGLIETWTWPSQLVEQIVKSKYLFRTFHKNIRIVGFV